MIHHLFLHIPKTAGCTITSVALRQYKTTFRVVDEPGHTLDFFRKLPQSSRDAMEYVHGHFPYGLHRHFFNPCKYVTMLREPIARVVSQYHFLMRCRTNPLNEVMRKDRPTLAQWAGRNWYGNLDNLQVRFLADRVDMAQVGLEAYHKARYVLTLKLATFGLVEHFDESLARIADALGWPTVAPSPAQNVYHQDGDEPTEEDRNVIMRNNLLDVWLYAYAKEIFRERTKA